MTVSDAVQTRQVGRSQPRIGPIMCRILEPVKETVLRRKAEIWLGIHIVMSQVEQRVKRGVKTFKRPNIPQQGPRNGRRKKSCCVPVL